MFQYQDLGEEGAWHDHRPVAKIRGGSRNFAKGGAPPPPDANAEGTNKMKRFLCAEGAQKMKNQSAK